MVVNSGTGPLGSVRVDGPFLKRSTADKALQVRTVLGDGALPRESEMLTAKPAKVTAIGVSAIYNRSV